MKPRRPLRLLACLCLLDLGSPWCAADQTLSGLTTVEGTLQVNPTSGLDALGIHSSLGDDASLRADALELQKDGGSSGWLEHSWLTRGGIGFNWGYLDNSDWKDFTAHFQLNPSGTTAGMGFYLDQTTKDAQDAVTGAAPLYYTWHRSAVPNGAISGDITQRAAPMMQLGGVSNTLRLIHPTDSTKGIVFDPNAGSITVNGKAVLVQNDLQGLDAGAQTVNVGYLAAAFGYGNNSAGSLALTSGQGNNATGFASAAIGAWCYAGGNTSMALGNWAWALGQSAVALSGPNTGAFGTGTLAAGSWSYAYGDHSMVLGRGLVVMQPDTVVVGVFNDFASAAMGSRTMQFVVGNGVENPGDPYYIGDSPNRSNALEIETNGRTTIRHKDNATDATAEALNVLGRASVSRSLTVTGAAALNGGATVTGNATISGNATVNGTVTSMQKMRVPPAGDLPMEFQNDGGLGVPGQ